jgi:hypothetical protein
VRGNVLRVDFDDGAEGAHARGHRGFGLEDAIGDFLDGQRATRRRLLRHDRGQASQHGARCNDQ